MIEDRVLLPVPRLRLLVLRWSSAPTDAESLSSAELRELQQLVLAKAQFLQPIMQLVRWDATAIPGVTRLLRALAKPSPLCGLILRPVETRVVLLRFAAGADVLASPANWRVMCDNFPLLAELVAGFRNDAGALTVLQNLSAVLAEKCIAFLAGIACLMRWLVCISHQLILVDRAGSEDAAFPDRVAVSIAQGVL